MNRQESHAPGTMGDALARAIAAFVGSWRFILSQVAFTAAWLLLNTLHGWQHWDQYPYVLLNLVYSFQAGFTGPILLLASNQQAKRDREIAARDDEEIGLLLQLQREQMEILRKG